jgi:hypothetical protein
MLRRPMCLTLLLFTLTEVHHGSDYGGFLHLRMHLAVLPYTFYADQSFSRDMILSLETWVLYNYGNCRYPCQIDKMLVAAVTIRLTL